MITGIGIDVVDVARVARMLERHGERLMARMLTDGERAYIGDRVDLAGAVAVRLAAKEAAYKALTGNDLARAIAWRDIEVRNDEHGAPSLTFHGRAGERARELNVACIWVSLSHSDASAVAVVVLERRDPGSTIT